jgi:hypothetical protein
VDQRASSDDVEERKFLTLPGLELRPLDRPAHSQSPYRLRYPGSRDTRDRVLISSSGIYKYRTEQSILNGCGCYTNCFIIDAVSCARKIDRESFLSSYVHYCAKLIHVSLISFNNLIKNATSRKVY